jgi:hypothetical protein
MRPRHRWVIAVTWSALFAAQSNAAEFWVAEHNGGKIQRETVPFSGEPEPVGFLGSEMFSDVPRGSSPLGCASLRVR